MNKPFSVRTLAQRWDVSKPTIHNMIGSGKIRNTFKVGNMIRIPFWEVERIEQCGNQNQNSTEENTTPSPDREPGQKENRYEPTDWMWH